jgi:divalent metal cation (Fe/Co/Zn/Cd) transporter
MMKSGSEPLWNTARYLEYFTVAYNILEALASIVFGFMAGSIALVGFGLDSIVESLSGLVLIWRLNQHGTFSSEAEERTEQRAQKFVAITFFLLGLYILYESVSRLWMQEVPRPSAAGIIIAILSIIIMPVLAWKKKAVGITIGSKALIADSRETITCAFLSVALFIGLGANYLSGFWQADPLVGIIIVVFLFREGYEGLTGGCRCDE